MVIIFAEAFQPTKLHGWLQFVMMVK